MGRSRSRCTRALYWQLVADGDEAQVRSGSCATLRVGIATSAHRPTEIGWDRDLCHARNAAKARRGGNPYGFATSATRLDGDATSATPPVAEVSFSSDFSFCDLCHACGGSIVRKDDPCRPVVVRSDHFPCYPPPEHGTGSLGRYGVARQSHGTRNWPMPGRGGGGLLDGVSDCLTSVFWNPRLLISVRGQRTHNATRGHGFT